MPKIISRLLSSFLLLFPLLIVSVSYCITSYPKSKLYRIISFLPNDNIWCDIYYTYIIRVPLLSSWYRNSELGEFTSVSRFVNNTYGRVHFFLQSVYHVLYLGSSFILEKKSIKSEFNLPISFLYLYVTIVSSQEEEIPITAQSESPTSPLDTTLMHSLLHFPFCKMYWTLI